MRHRSWSSSVLAVALLLALSSAAGAQGEIWEAAGDTSDRFAGGNWWINGMGGPCVAMTDELIVVGTVGDDLPGEANHGSATVFRRNGASWTEEQRLVPVATGSFGGLAGFSVDVSADVVVVGVPFANGGGSEQGIAATFRWNGSSWIEGPHLADPAGQDSDQFGTAVAVCGDVAVVGAPQADLGADFNAGTASVFRWNGTTWVFEQQLTASGGAAFDHFGASVAIHGTAIVVGAVAGDAGATADAGTATVFRWNGANWVEEDVLSSPTPGSGAWFGNSTSIDGDVIVVGSVYATVGGNPAQGSASVFRWNGASWGHEQELTATGGDVADTFGCSVAVSGAVIVVGAHSDDIGATLNQGSATLFRWDATSWIEQPLLTAANGVSQDLFGAAVSAHLDEIVVGAPQHDVLGKGNQGVAYVIDVAAPPWSDAGNALVGIFGDPLLSGAGDLSAGGLDALTLTGAAPSANCALFIAGASTPVPFKGGTLLPFPFLPPVFLTTTATGTLPIPFVMPAGIPPGTQLWLQWAIQDAAAPNGVSLSNALRGVTA